MEKNMMKSFVILAMLIRGSSPCKLSSSEGGENNQTPTPVPELYNCSYSDGQGRMVDVSVRDITNDTEVVCEVVLTFPEENYTDAARHSEADKKMFCNELGNSACPNCINYTTRWSYKTEFENVTVSCKKEETTTAVATTVTSIPTTVDSTVTETQARTTTIGAEPTMDYIIWIGVCGGIIFAIVICVILIIFRRVKQKKSSEDKEDVAVAYEADTGDLYTTVEKNPKTSSQIVENVLYGGIGNGQKTENGDLYTEVQKKRVDNPVQDLYATVDKKIS